MVVDEEHDASYKHEGDPRYDARRVAAERARRAGARLLVGSATPRPETWRALPRLTLRERADGRPLPPVRVLDMRGAGHPLHPETRRALGEARKAIVLLNRRGWSNFLTCRSCGKVWECPQCDVALVLHRAQGAIACHHCGHREPVPQRCDACGSLAVARYGAGTERVEHELREALEVPVFRLDADTAGAKDAVPELLARFDAAPAGLLLGTQMVAKGHDFPDVTLGVVLDADSTLRFPDFRAEERTFALIAQLAGRAGRGPRGGHVLVQTTSPDAPAILAAAQHDTEGFVAGELGRREALRYPPFADLIRIVFLAEDAAAARTAAGQVGEALAARAGAGSQVLGPAPLFRLRGRDRFQLVVKTQRREAAIAAVRAAVERAARDRAHRQWRSPWTSTRNRLGRADVRARRSHPTGRGRGRGARGGRRGPPRTPGSGDARAPRRRAAARPQVRRPFAQEPRAADRALRRRAARRGAAHGAADARRARDRPRGHPARGHAPRARLSRRGRRARRRARQSGARVVREREEALEEGCLSLPGVLVDVERPIHVRVRAFDEYGDELMIEASGLEARVIQHEMDHLDGVLILERTSREERKQAMRILREEAGAAPLGVAS